MMKFVVWTVVLLLLATAALGQSRGPKEAVAAFYRFNDAHSDLFDRKHVESRKRWYTPVLYNAFRHQLKKDKAYLGQHPTDKPFFGDGLDFQPLQETCELGGRSYNWRRTVGRAKIRSSRASVMVKFAYPKACEPKPTIYRLNLIKVKGKWLIDDLIYPDDSTTLRRDMSKFKY